MDDQLLDSWDLHSHMLFMLFDAIEPEAFAGKPVGMSGRSVGNIFAHIHGIRLAWIEVADPALMEALTKIPTKSKAEREAISKDQLRPALESSAAAIRTLLETSLEKGKIKGMKPHLIGSFSYFIAHEWYHIGEIGMTLTLSGHKLDDETSWGIWSWDRWQSGGKPPRGKEE
ncbi:MAG: DinB family protein [Chloroflexota bacterium]